MLAGCWHAGGFETQTACADRGLDTATKWALARTTTRTPSCSRFGETRSCFAVLAVIPTSLVDKDPHGGEAVQGGVGPVVIVGGDPAVEGLEPGRVGAVEALVGPLVEEGLDVALGLAVGLGPVGARDEVAGAEAGRS